jgi:hypothetical protein
MCAGHTYCFHPGELERIEQLFLENMLHNFIFVALKVSLNSKYISREVQCCYWLLRLAGQIHQAVGWTCGMAPAACWLYSLQPPCHVPRGIQQICSLENHSTGTYLRATFWEFYHLLLRRSKRSDWIKIGVGGGRRRNNCQGVFIKCCYYF